MTLTESQTKAIHQVTGNLQLVACAGSGKTEVVALRVANLLAPISAGGGGCVPSNIVAFTFTDKAAAELKERIHQRCQERFGQLVGMAEMYVGTIHAFCLDLLKNEVPEYLKFEVLNEVQQFLFIDRNSKRTGLTTSTTLDGNPLKRWVDTGSFLGALSILREDKPIDPKLLAGNSVAASLNQYEAVLDEKGYLDYSSILALAAERLENDAGLQSRLSERVKHVIVDEYQDVNLVQERIVRAMHKIGASICVVGDDDQTIYQWRGSSVDMILTFAKRYPKVKQIRIEENFRSSKGIVETARDFIAQNPDRLKKAMQPTTVQTYEKDDLIATRFDTPQEEAEYIAHTCKSLYGVAFKEGDVERGLAWSDMAILLRSVRASGEPITDALRVANIPYIVVGMNNLFRQPEAEAARQLFYYLAGRDDVGDAELRDAWTSVDLGLDPKTLKRAIADAKKARTEMGDARIGQFKVYNLQRQFIAFLERINLREERVPGNHGETVFYNLGKFSQVISDFEAIHFHSEPVEKYRSFAQFLQYGASEAYPEGEQANQYANPNAVQIMTVHQAKGMQWPALFVPQLTRNRFPSKGGGGRTAWHLIPPNAFEDQQRYKGDISDERRLFYVAMTRSQKFLHMTWAPKPGNSQAQHASEFFEDVLASKYVRRFQPDYTARPRLPSKPKVSVEKVVLSFSDIKYFFECPYQFKLRILYGFNPPLDEALGYGKSLHDTLAEVHKRAILGDYVNKDDAEELVQRHLRTPYAYKDLREKLEHSARQVVADYIVKNRNDFDKIEFAEKTIELGLGDGVTVAGRIDLVTRIDTGETSIVDLKSSDRTQPEIVTETQLHLYALGYHELTGRNADYVETYLLDEGKQKRRSVDKDFMLSVKIITVNAANALRENKLTPIPKQATCKICDYARMCSASVANVP